MNLCESLRQIIGEYGLSAIGDERLPGLIAEKGTDVAPGAADAIRAFSALRLRLCPLGREGGEGPY